MHHLSSPRRAAAAAAGVVVSSLFITEFPAQASTQEDTSAHANTAAGTRQGAAACADSRLVYRPRSDFPGTPAGTSAYQAQAARLRSAVLCLVNTERASRRLPALSTDQALSNAAGEHVTAAVSLRWWGKKRPGKNCVVWQSDPATCNPHINPRTRSDTGTRVRNSGYLTGCRRSAYAENAYTWAGTAGVTPQAAVTWWMGSPGHRAAILNPAFKQTGIGVTWGSADSDTGSISPAATYVQVFGYCTR